MFNEKINEMIMSERKAGHKDVVLVYQEIKTSFTNFKTAANAKPLDDAAEVSIIRKLIKEHQETLEGYKTANNTVEVEKEARAIDILSELLPAGPTEDDMRKFIEEFKTTLGDEPFDIKKMGKCIGYVKSKLPTVDGSQLSALVKSYF